MDKKTQTDVPPGEVDRLREERFRLMVERVDDHAMVLLDPTGIIESWNSGARRISQYESEEVSGRHFSIFYTPEDQAAGEPARELAAALRDGKFERDCWRVRKDGTIFPAHVIVTALRDTQGAHTGFSSVTRDQTGTRRAEEQSEERLRMMVEGVQDYAIFMLDPDGIIRTWNSGAARIKQWAAHEIIGKHFSIFYDSGEVDAGTPERELEIANRHGKFEREGWRKRKDGSAFWANVIITALRDKNDNLVGFSKVTRDLTERKKAEEAIQRSEARFAGIVRISEDAIISIDDQQNITLFNEGAEKIFGYQSADVLGKKINLLIPPRFGAVHDTHVKSFGSSADALRPMNERGSIFGLRKDGSEFPAEASISKFEVAGEKVLTVRLRDITERKRAEEHIRNSLEEKEILLKEIHHRVKNNLQVVSSLLSLQSGYPRVESVRELFLESQNRVKSMALIHEKLYQSEDFSNIDFADYIESLARNLFHSYGVNPEQITLTIDVDVELDIDHAIPCGLIVNELLSNSLKHAFPEERSGAVKLRFHEHEHQFTLHFSDNGIGLPAGIDFRNTESLGLQLVTTLTSQIGGVIRHLPGEGTAFEIAFATPRQAAKKEFRDG